MSFLKEKINIGRIAISSIVVTMLCHSLCCILPMLGFIISFNVVGAVMHQYEYVYIILNIVSIVVGFYITYFHKKKKKCDHSQCHKTNVHGYWIATGISIFLMIVSHLII
jgi:predicted Co/Zn/Cd cation transporter (cation efflux family)